MEVQITAVPDRAEDTSFCRQSDQDNMLDVSGVQVLQQIRGHEAAGRELGDEKLIHGPAGRRDQGRRDTEERGVGVLGVGWERGRLEALRRPGGEFVVGRDEGVGVDAERDRVVDDQRYAGVEGQRIGRAFCAGLGDLRAECG